MASNEALLYAESMIGIRKKQWAVDMLANAFDAGHRAGALTMSGWQRDALQAQAEVARLRETLDARDRAQNHPFGWQSEV